jgi:hypothetical protein
MIDLMVRIGGGVVAFALGALTAVFEVFYSNLRLGTALVPAAMLVAFGANVGLTRFAWFTVGPTWAPALAFVPWCVVMVAAVVERPDGDWLILPNNWAGALTVVAGMAGFAVPFLRLVKPRRLPSAP